MHIAAVRRSSSTNCQSVSFDISIACAPYRDFVLKCQALKIAYQQVIHGRSICQVTLFVTQ